MTERPAHPSGRFWLAYRPTLPRTWWLRNRRYSFFGLRELTAIPVVAWLLSLLVEIAGVRPFPGLGEAHSPMTSPLYIAFSIVCFAGAVLHSITWLNLSGVILRVKLGDRAVAPLAVTLANYAQWAGVTVVVGALLIWLGTWR